MLNESGGASGVIKKIHLTVFVALILILNSCGQRGRVQNCDQWVNLLNHLTSEEIHRLSSTGVIRAEGKLIIAEKFVPDCRVRFQVSSYLGARLAGADTSEYNTFVKSNSMELCIVIKKIWPILHSNNSGLRDGNFESETYNLLSDPSLTSSCLSSLLNKLLLEEGLHADLVYVLLSQKSAISSKELLITLDKAQELGDVASQVYALALLFNEGNQDAIEKLRLLKTSVKATDMQKEIIQKLLLKMIRNEEIRFSDLEDLENDN